MGKKMDAQYKDASFWGAEDENGIMYRINKATNTADRIISKGKVFYYSGMELKFKIKGDDPGGKTKETLDIKAKNGVKFSDIFWISKGASGAMMGASKENLSKLLADSPDLVSKVQNIDETNPDNWVDDYGTIRDLIVQYNKAHQNSSSKRTHK